MKTTKTYSIEESIYKAFDTLTTERNINKSSFIEDHIKKFLKDNDMDYVDKLYSLKTNPDHIVTVLSQDSTYYFLDDGSKIQKILFMQIFKECESINPNEFFKKSEPILEKIVEKIKNIDNSKIDDYNLPPESFFSTLDEINFAYEEKNKDKKDSDELNDINNKFIRTGEYYNSSKLELCNVIIKLNKLKFSTYSRYENRLKENLIKLLTERKNSITV